MSQTEKRAPPETWEELGEHHRAWLLTSGYSSETVHLHVWNMGLFARWADAHGVSLAQASRQEVSAYLVEQLERLALSTVHSRLYTLRSWFAQCRQERWRRDDPTAGVRIKRVKNQCKRPFTREELCTLLDACLNERDRAIILVLAATGIRLSELLGMRPDDIDWENGTVLIRGKGSKERFVALGRVALEALRGQVNGGTGPIWRVTKGDTTGGPIPRVGLRFILRRIGLRAGVSPVYAHRFRVSFANSFLQAGGDLQALQMLMGHATIEMTAHYAGWTAASRALEQQRRFCLADQLVPHAEGGASC